MTEMLYPLEVIGVIALITGGLRAFPFLLFRRKPLPGTMKYLGMALPPAIMSILVIYCLRNTDFKQYPFGLSELVSCALVIILQLSRKNMYLSIIVGTVCYMILIRSL